MTLDEGISKLIGRIYESAHENDRWDAMLEEVRQRLGVRCLFQSISRLDSLEMQRAVMLGDPKKPDGLKEYLDHWVHLDPSFQWAAKHPHSRFCSTDEVIPARDYLDNQFIRWERDELIGSTHWIVGYTPPDDRLTFGLSAHPFDGPLTESGKSLFRLLFDHMERAARLAVLPPQLFSPNEALIVLDATARVRHVSPKAETIISAADGLLIAGGRLSTSYPENGNLLEEATNAALSAPVTGSCGSACLVRRPSGMKPYLITSSPLPRGSGPFADFAPAVMLRIVTAESDSAATAASRLARMYGLTPREIEIAEALMLGHSLDSASEVLGISRNTIRVHLQALFRKTDTNRQSELIRLMTEVTR